MRPKIKGWTASRKAGLAIALFEGMKEIVDICRKNELRQSELEK